MSLLSLDELRELAPGYVMATLSASELAAFEAALANATYRAELEPEIAAHRAAMEYLALENVVTPPPALRGRVMERITTERGAPLSLANTVEFSSVRPTATRSESSAGAPVGAPVGAPMGAPASGPAVFTERRAVRVTPQHVPMAPQMNTRPAWLTAGVLGLAMAASLIFALSLRNQVGDLETQLSQQQLLAQRLGERLADRDKTVNVLTGTDNDLMVVKLVANENAGPSMRVFWNRRTGEAVIRAANFAQIPDTRTYVLWMIRDGKPESVQLFTPDAGGERLINTVALPRDPRGIVAFAVTEEPAGGSPQPTMEPFLVGQVRGSSE